MTTATNTATRAAQSSTCAAASATLPSARHLAVLRQVRRHANDRQARSAAAEIRELILANQDDAD